MTQFAMLDWLVLGLFLLALVGIIVWVSRMKEDTSSDYFLAGKNATWVVIGASIFASNIGSEHLVGLAGAGASSGMAMAHWEMQGWLILILGWVFVPFYDRSGVFTMPEFLEKRYNGASRSILSIISLISYVLTKVAVTVYAGGIVFKEVFGIESVWGIDFFWIGAIGLVIITGIYTVIGGMKAVLYTSVLQTPVLLIGSLTILFIGLDQLGGWDELMNIVGNAGVTYTDDVGNVVYHSSEDKMSSLIRSVDDPEFPWIGVILGSAIIGFWYWCTDQYIVQRVLSARDQTQARRGTIFGAYLKTTPVFIFLIPGMIAYALNEKGIIDLSSGDAAFPTLVSSLLPAGLKGVVVGGLLAALMSSLASLFNSSAMLFTVDFYKKYRPETSEHKLVQVGRMATVVIVILGILWIPVMQSLGDVLYEYLQQVQGLLAPGIAAVFFMGVFYKRATPLGGMWGLIIGFVLGMLRLVLNIFSSGVDPDSFWYEWFIATNWLNYTVFLFFLTIGIIALISAFTPKPRPEQINSLTYGAATEAETEYTRRSWNKWDVFHTVVILAIIIGFYIYFW
jgi:SSS family solute:Na+ symporter